MKYNESYLARRLALSLIIGGMFVSSAYALPQGGAVVGGGSNGNIGGSGNVMEITGTGSNNVAIKWEQFNIANGETVNFKNMANVLNYVTGNTKSEIYGTLNGQGVNVFLLNPNGILFGKGAAVNVGSLHASTGKMTDAAINGFNGTPAIDLSRVTADVLNLGAIRADKVTIEGANISLGNAADIKKQNGDAIAAADQANYILKAEGTINVGYETIGTKNISIIENGVSTERAIRDYSAGAAEKGSTLFMGKKLNGSEANNINDCMLISDIYELQSISTDKTYEPNRFSKFMLAGDIDGTATKNWNSGSGFKTLFSSGDLSFTGVFDGAGYTISNLYINSSTAEYGGLFGVSVGKIANVQLSGIDYNFTGGIKSIGGLVGYNLGITSALAGSVRNVQTSGKITASNLTSGAVFIGGIVGTNASTVAAGNGTITNAFYFNPSTQRYYDYDGAEYTSTEAFNQSFMEGAAASGEQAAWLGYSDGRTTPQLQAFLSPLDVSIGNIEVEITDGDIYTGLAQAIIDKLTAMGVEFDASKIKAVEVKEAGTYDLSSLLYSTQDGYKITIGDGGKLTVTVNAKKPEVPPVDPPIGPSVINDAALINIQHVDDDLRVVQQTLEPEKYAEDEEGRVKIMGTGIKI